MRQRAIAKKSRFISQHETPPRPWEGWGGAGAVVGEGGNGGGDDHLLEGGPQVGGGGGDLLAVGQEEPGEHRLHP